MKRGELTLSLILLAIFLVFFWEAQNIPAGFMVESVQREVGADFWPKVLLVMLIVLTGALNIKFLKARRRSKMEAQTIAGEKERWWTWLVLIFSVVMYIWIQHIIGFILASSFLVAGSLIILGYRRKVGLVAISLSTGLLFTLIFGRFLYVPLPKGIGIFRTVSLLLY